MKPWPAPHHARARAAAIAVALTALAAGCGGPGAADEQESADPRTLLTASELQSVLLTQRTLGATYAVTSVVPAALSAPLGCLDDLDPMLLGADVDGATSTARVEYVATTADSSASVSSRVISMSSDRAAGAAFNAFSTAAADCTAVAVEDGSRTTRLEVAARLVPVKAPVVREVLVEAHGHRDDGVLTPALGVAVKVGRIGHHLVAVETTGLGEDPPDLTPYYNITRARLIAVLDGDDPGPGRPVRP